MNCSRCGDPLSDARLNANPVATECVTCLLAEGDVSLIRRYDELSDQTYYIHNPAIDAARDRNRLLAGYLALPQHPERRVNLMRLTEEAPDFGEDDEYYDFLDELQDEDEEDDDEEAVAAMAYERIADM